jgi:nicotinate-nucleotide pyrophosphorylase (carboxylating)
VTAGVTSPWSRFTPFAGTWQGVAKEPVEQLIEMAVHEDGALADITTAVTVDDETRAVGSFIAKEHGIVAGLPVAEMVFAHVDEHILFASVALDGDDVQAGQEIARITGSAETILVCERIALNFLQRMSGIATQTGQFVAAVRRTNATILDTRKTVPGFRELDKYSVACGGGQNHRANLGAGVLIKDNHIAAAGGITPVLRRVNGFRTDYMTVEIEVDRLDQIEEALAGRPDIVLLDNMTVGQLGEAVKLIDRRALTEASGGVTLETVGAIAETGVDFISVGSLTHSVRALDISLDMELTT